MSFEDPLVDKNQVTDILNLQVKDQTNNQYDQIIYINKKIKNKYLKKFNLIRNVTLIIWLK